MSLPWSIEITDREARESLFREIADDVAVTPQEWYNEDDEWPVAEGPWHAAQEFRHDDGRRWIVHYRMTDDDPAEPEPRNVTCIEAFPRYTIRDMGEVLRIRNSFDGEWYVPTVEDDGLWDAIERFDDANSTRLYDEMIEGVGCNYVWEVQ